MNQNTTILKSISPETSDRSFAFDHSYWSFDGYKIESNGYLAPEKDSNYCDQKKVFNDLGTAIVKNSFDGFNACILAYGQTGSGLNS